MRGEGAAEVFRAAGFALPGAPWPSAGSGRLPAGGSAVAPAASWAAPFARSLWVATASVALSLPWALGLGALLARREFFGKALLNTLLLSPLVLPPVVTGYLLLRLCGRNGPLGAFGLEVAFTRWGAVVAASVVGFPLLLLTVRSAFESVDPRYEQLAQTLGLHPLAAFARVTLPMALPGLVAGCVLAFARALGEFGATAVLAGDVPGETRTLALAVFALYEEPGGEEDARVLVWISLGLCLVALVGAERLTAAQRRRAREGEAA
ncbi:MAG: molybdate ABC transporter permease subunit [Planctomycetota bacterium]|nr:MAG: molybdate ABC transporter permease subunit [Planctomycetota bacterium]